MKIYMLLAICGVLIGGVGQGMFLPLFISTFIDGNNHPGEYFVFFIMSLSFIPIFGLLFVKDLILKSNKKIAITKEMILMGIFDALNGLLVVFTSALGRTSGDLQSLLLQFAIPFTLIFSRIIYKIRPSRKEIIAALVVIVGILISVGPSYADLKDSTTKWIYPVLFMVAIIPGVLMNIVLHGVFDKHPNINRNFVLLIESVVQLVTCVCLFWADLIPGFGTSKNMTEFRDNFKWGFECFFDPRKAGGRCDLSWVLGIGFSIFYCISYASALYIIKKSTANFYALVSSLCPPIQLFIWYVWPSLSRWGNGPTPDKKDIVFGLTAMIVLIIPGSIAYRYYEKQRRKQEDSERSPLLVQA